MSRPRFVLLPNGRLLNEVAATGLAPWAQDATPVGFEPIAWAATCARFAALVRRSRQSDPRVIHQALTRLTPTRLAALRKTDPQLAEIVALAQQPLPIIDADDDMLDDRYESLPIVASATLPPRLLQRRMLLASAATAATRRRDRALRHLEAMATRTTYKPYRGGFGRFRVEFTADGDAQVLNRFGRRLPHLTIDERGMPIRRPEPIVAAAAAPEQNSTETAVLALATAVERLANRPSPDVHVHMPATAPPVVHVAAPNAPDVHVTVQAPERSPRAIRVEVGDDGVKRYVVEDA